MVKRYALLRKKLFKEGIVLAVGVVIMATLGLLLQNYAEDIQSEQRIKENEVSASRAKLTDLRKEMDSGLSQTSLYSKYIAHHNPDLTLNRESATKWLVAQREKFHLVNLSIVIPPFTDVSKDIFHLKSGKMIKSDVKLTFGALTDNSVFAFIEEIQKSMPGVAVIQDIKLTRSGDITSNVLIELNNHHIMPIVTADISLAWFGLRPDVKAADAQGNINAK